MLGTVYSVLAFSKSIAPLSVSPSDAMSSFILSCKAQFWPAFV